MTEDTISAWQFVLADEDPVRMLATVRYLAKTKTEHVGFAPTPPEILSAANELSRSELPLAEESWHNGPNVKDLNAIEKRAWELWGGNSSAKVCWGMLPDVAYCDNKKDAMITMATARKRFLECFQTAITEHDKKPHHLSHREALKFLDGLQKAGLSLETLMPGTKQLSLPSTTPALANG